MSDKPQPSSSLNQFTTAKAAAPEAGISDKMQAELKALTEKPMTEHDKAHESFQTQRKELNRDMKEDDEAPLTYEQRLEKYDVSKTEAMEMIDAMAFDFDYKETIKVTPKVKAQFQLRTTRFNNFLADKIDMADPRKVGKMNQLMTEYQLAASLCNYAGQDLNALGEDTPMSNWVEALENRRKFVLKLPTPVFAMLCTRLMRFDLKNAVVFSEGYEANF